MENLPYGVTSFCDDVRLEIGGKISLIGCYPVDMMFSQSPPAVIPIFNAFVHLRIPTNYKFNQVAIILVKETLAGKDEILSETVITTNRENLRDEEQDDDTIIISENQLKVSPLVLNEDCILKVRGFFDKKEVIKLGALPIKFNQKNPFAPRNAK